MVRENAVRDESRKTGYGVKQKALSNQMVHLIIHKNFRKRGRENRCLAVVVHCAKGRGCPSPQESRVPWQVETSGGGPSAFKPRT